MVFFGGGDHVIYALNISDGSVAWSFTTGSVIYSSPSVANGVLYIGGVNKYIYALDPTKGTVLWSFKTGASVWSSPTTLYSNGRLYLGLKSGYFYCVDATNGNIIWQYKTGASGDFGVWSSATLYNNMVFFVGTTHFQVLILEDVQATLT